MRHVVIIGAQGQLGSDLQSVLGGFRVSPLTRADLDVSRPERARRVLAHLRPDVVINTSAFHVVDLCEDEPAEAFAINAVGVHDLAQMAHEFNFTLVHFSTDYVFDGRANSPYAEDSCPGPLSVYAASKLAGEFLVRNACPCYFVIRTTGLYGVAGTRAGKGNFVETMLRLGRSGAPIRVVDDQVLTPTWSADLARAVAALLRREESDGVAYGLYHVTNSGQCSWFEFARAIFDLLGMNVDLEPIETAKSGRRARRPAYSVLGHERWLAAGLPESRPWRDALREYLLVRGNLTA